MKTFILLLSLICSGSLSAQKTSDLLKQQAGEGVKEGASIATQKTADKVTDKILGKLFSKKNKNKNSNKNSNSTTAGNTTAQAAPSASNSANISSTTVSDNIATPGGTIKTYSKYDFVPGAKVLAYEDFSQDAIGDFPLKWNTNSAGEIVTASGQTGNWLMLNKKGIFIPEFINNLPDNFTLEYDLIYLGGNYLPSLQLLFLSAGNGKDGKQVLNADFGYNKRSGVNLGMQPIPRDKGGIATIDAFQDGEKMMGNQIQFQNDGNSKIKVSIWRQKERLRVYLDQNKVFDLPKAFPAGKTYSTMLYQILGDFIGGEEYLISNIKLAIGDPDTRNKLLTEGKFSTTGILFDVNSAVIKPESYGTLKEIAGVLQDNTNVKVKIIGHTDSDGDAAQNLALSRKRAEAVKSALTNEFKINASRIETDGKGASDPVADNKTPEGKAQNRRVEFVKL
ncbi:MAG: OmpA family protein [Bacteroidota bacterium]|nr:OmpA family protein [Bacteroidota bacterium]